MILDHKVLGRVLCGNHREKGATEITKHSAVHDISNLLCVIKEDLEFMVVAVVVTLSILNLQCNMWLLQIILV